MSIQDKMNKDKVKVKKHSIYHPPISKISEGDNIMVETKTNKVIIPVPKTKYNGDGTYTVHGALFDFHALLRDVHIKDAINSVCLNVGMLHTYLVTNEHKAYFAKCFDRFCRQAFESIGSTSIELDEDDQLLIEYGMLDESKYQTEFETLKRTILEAMQIEVDIMSENLNSLI